MRKPFLIGLIVCLVAIGGIGAAFATGMNFNAGVGSLSTGIGTVPQVNVSQINWGPDDLTYDPLSDEPTLTRVWLHFDQDLNQGTGIVISLYNAAGALIADTLSNLPAALAAGGTYQGPNFAIPPAVSQIYYIRVTVFEGAGP